jgi:hypothetical protein
MESAISLNERQPFLEELHVSEESNKGWDEAVQIISKATMGMAKGRFLVACEKEGQSSPWMGGQQDFNMAI